jgi:hypothetical protein
MRTIRRAVLGLLLLCGTNTWAQSQIARATLSIVVSGHSVKTTWSASSTAGITGYKLYRSATSGSGYAQVGTTVSSVLTYTDTTVSAGKTYYFVVTAYSSNVCNITTITATGSSTLFTWSLVSGATGYTVQRSTNGGAWTTLATVGATITSYTDTTTVSGTSYRYFALPTTTPPYVCGESANSNEVKAVIPTP